MTPHDDLDRLASADLDAADVQILADLRDLWTRVDPPPAGLAERMQFAMTVACLEAEVAQMVQGGGAAVGVRTAYERASTVTFTSESVSAMIDIEKGDDGVTVSGWVSDSSVEVEMQERRQSRRTSVDANGRFGFGATEPGMVHFVFRHTGPDEGRPVITPAIEL